MSDKSLFVDHTEGRPLRQEERELVGALLKGHHAIKSLSCELDVARVKDMDDGGMGSVRFVRGNDTPRFGRTLAEARYTDADGKLVSIAMNCDHLGNIFEMDFWKVDFSPLKRYPVPSEVEIIEETP